MICPEGDGSMRRLRSECSLQVSQLLTCRVIPRINDSYLSSSGNTICNSKLVRGVRRLSRWESYKCGFSSPLSKIAYQPATGQRRALSKNLRVGKCVSLLLLKSKDLFVLLKNRGVCLQKSDPFLRGKSRGRLAGKSHESEPWEENDHTCLCHNIV